MAANKLFMLLCAPLLAAWALAQEPDAPTTYRTVVIGTGGQRVLWMVSNPQESVDGTETCTSVSVFNRTGGALLWREIASGDASLEPGLRHIYSTALHGHLLSAMSLSNGKRKWDFPRPPGFFKRRDPLNLPPEATLFGPHETKAPAGAPSDDLIGGGSLQLALLARTPGAAASAPPSSGTAVEPWVVLVASRNPGNHLYAVSEDTGQLVWELALEPGYNITAVALPDELPSLALLSVVSGSDEDGGPSGSLVAVDLVNGTIRWPTGPLSTGAPSLALATATSLVLRGGTDADLTQTLYGLHAATGAMIWTKTCSRGCTILQVDERTAVIASYAFTVSELEAVDLPTGKIIWRGVDSSSEPDMSCTGAVVAHRHIFFGCPCNEEETAGAVDATAAAIAQGPAARTRLQRPKASAADPARLESTAWEAAAAVAVAGQQRRRVLQEGATADASGASGTGSSGSGEDDGDAAVGRRDGPDQPGGARLCGYAVSTETGEAVWRSKLYDNNSFPALGGASGLRPLVVAETVLLATQAGVHALDRSSGKRRWTFKLPDGQELKAWDMLDEQDGIVVVRSSGTPPQDSRVYGIDLASGQLLVDQSVPQSYGTPDGNTLPYDIRDGVVYMDACSGSHCCLLAVDMAVAPPPPLSPTPADYSDLGADGQRGPLGSDGRADAAHVAATLRRQLRSALAGAAGGKAPGGGVEPGPDPSGGGGGGGGRSFQYCFDVAQACRAKHARNVGLDIIYALLAAQLVIIVAGFGSVVVWRMCCRRRYAPYTLLNVLPVVEVPQHDIASEEPDDDSAEGEGEGKGGRVMLAVDEATGLAVPVLQVRQAAVVVVEQVAVPGSAARGPG